jgi:hypothetical protein
MFVADLTENGQQKKKKFTAKESQAYSAKKIYNDMSVPSGGKCPSYSTVTNGVARFRIGHLSTEDDDCSKRPTQVTIPENVDAIHPMILDD